MKKGLSKRSKVVVGSRLGASTYSTLGPSRREERLADAKALRQREIADMSIEQRQSLLDAQGPATDYEMADGESMGLDDAFMHPPIGAEGAEHSHAGGDREVMREIEEKMTRNSLRPKDPRTRSDRTQRAQDQWNQQYPRLVDSYLMWRHEAWQPTPITNSSPPPPVVNYDEESSPDPTSDAPSGDGNFSMESVDTFDHNIYEFRRPDNMQYTNEGLLRSGFVGATPLYPTVAISIRTLEDHRQTHRVCPRLSIQATVRKLCHVHNQPFHRYLCHQFSEAFDIYLEILHRVNLKISAALGQDSEDWHLKNACPCCMYELNDEELLAHRLLMAMDGNNSLRLVDDSFRRGTQRADTRSGRASNWLSAEYVDIFKDEVPSRGKSGGMGNPTEAEQGDDNVDEDGAWLDIEVGAEGTESGHFKKMPVDMDSPVADDPLNPCTERWKNAGPDGQKKMFSMFLITGVFLCLCRHGILLLLCDMIQSGELAKYPLAMVSKILEVLGDRNALAYDIGCAFEQTVSHSSLGTRALAQLLKFVVPSFHGHAHNRTCQLNYHPQYITALGIEDFETCERCFSISNGLAGNTRLATRFHRQQAIEQHFQFQDQDKYAELSKFIFNNYQQSLGIISTNTIILNKACAELNITGSDFDKYLDEERVYLASLKTERLENTLHLDYVKALDHLRAMIVDERTAAAKNTHDARDRAIAQGAIGKDLTKLTRAHTTAFNRVTRADEQVTRLEAQLDITERWTANSADYIRVTDFIKNRKYLKAVDTLERLVVQRLFELTKMNHSGTAYKLRRQIAKALGTRSQAIRTALNNYNRLAQTLDPPRPPLDFQEVVLYSSLAEFDLLRDNRNTVQNRIWAQPSYRAAMALYFKMKCAQAEIKRLNVEITRLRTFIRDDTALHLQVINSLQAHEHGLAAALSHQWELRAKVNLVHLTRLNATACLPGYTGDHDCGVRKGGHAPVNAIIVGQVTQQNVAREMQDLQGDLSDDDVVQDTINTITDFIADAQ